MSTAQIRAIEDYNRLINRNAVVHAIRSAFDLGILKALETGQKTLAELAELLELNEEPLKLLMNVLCETELIEKYDEDYALSAVARLIPSQVQDLGDRYWQYLSGVVRSGIRLPVDKEVPVSERDFLIDSAVAEWTNTPVAMSVADALEMGSKRKAFRILELGCGAAVFSAALAHRDPTTHLVLVDEPAAIKRAQKTVESVNLQSRTQVIESSYDNPQLLDYFDNDQFDMVLIAGILNRHSPDHVKALLARFRNLVKPAGELAIVDIFPGQEKGDKHRAIFELELFLRTSSGTLQSPDQVQAMLEEVDFSNIQYAHIPAPPYIWGLLLAHRN